MNRVVIPEEHAKEELVKQQSNSQQSNARQNNAQQSNTQQPLKQQIPIANLEKGFTISAEELEQMFYEWDANGKNDLTVDDGSIAKKIEAYLEYQETLKPLKVKLAEEQFERFLVESVDKGSGKSVESKIYLNKKIIATAMIFSKNSVYGYMNFEDFRIILCSCKNPYAYYPYKNEKRIIDVRGWVSECGGTFEKNDYDNIEIEFPLPQLQEKKLSWLQRVLKKMGTS